MRGSGAAVRWRSARGSERRGTRVGRSLDPRGSGDVVLVVFGMQSPLLSQTRRRFLLFTSLSRFLAVMNGSGYAIAMQLCPITSSRCGSGFMAVFCRTSLRRFTVVCWPIAVCILKKFGSKILQCFYLLIVGLLFLLLVLQPLWTLLDNGNYQMKINKVEHEVMLMPLVIKTNWVEIVRGCPKFEFLEIKYNHYIWVCSMLIFLVKI